MNVEIHPDPDRLASAAAHHIADWFTSTRHHTIGLAGGSTPRRTYEVVRDLDLPWERITGWMTDERHVPIDHEDSNAGMAAAALFDHVQSTLMPVPTDLEAPEAADAYSNTLDQLFSSTPTDGIGLVLLGIGDDGHTASLFPGTAALEELHATYVANWLPDREVWRLTATIPLLANADRTIFLVSGEAKADVVRQIMSGTSYLPAAVVSRASSDAVWLLDEAAAAAIDH